MSQSLTVGDLDTLVLMALNLQTEKRNQQSLIQMRHYVMVIIKIPKIS